MLRKPRNGMCCDPFTGSCISEPTGDETPAPNPTPTPTPQGCPAGYLPNGQGMCCDPVTGQCLSEGNGGGGGSGGNPAGTQSTPFLGCPDGFLPNGQGLCCKPGSNECVQEATQQNGKTWKKVVNIEVGPITQSTTQFCKTIVECTDWYSCSYSPGYPENGVDCQYSHTNCKTSIECGAGNGESGGTTGGGTTGGGTTGGTGSGTGSGTNSNGFAGYTPRIIRPERKSEIFSTQCAGLRAMWDYSYRNNDPILTKEMHGLLTTDGKVVILPSYDNTATSFSLKSEYYDEQGRVIMNIYLQQGKIKGLITLYRPEGWVGDTIEFEVVATIHTHPFDGPELITGINHPPYIPSPNDINQIAASYPEIAHYILSRDKLTQYNSTGKIGDTAHNCP